jgi:hypothetical protein
MAIIGPKIIALGDIVFIRAQISPARQKIPRSCHIWLIEIRIIIPIAVSIFPLNGTLRL